MSETEMPPLLADLFLCCNLSYFIHFYIRTDLYSIGWEISNYDMLEVWSWKERILYKVIKNIYISCFLWRLPLWGYSHVLRFLKTEVSHCWHQFDRTHVVCGCVGISTWGCCRWSRHLLCVFLCSDAMVCCSPLKWSYLLPHLRDEIMGTLSNWSPAKTDTNADFNPHQLPLFKELVLSFSHHSK